MLNFPEGWKWDVEPNYDSCADARRASEDMQMRSFAMVAAVLLLATGASAEPVQWQHLEFAELNASIESPIDLVKQPAQRVQQGQVAPIGWAAQGADGSRYMFTASMVPAEYGGLSDVQLAQGTANAIAGPSTLLSRGMISENGVDGAEIRFIHPNGQPMRMRIIARRPWIYSLTVATKPGAEAELEAEPAQRFLGSLKLK